MEYEPCLAIFCGPSFTGKTTLAKELSRRTNFRYIDGDNYRYQILGHSESLPDEQEAAVMNRTYEMLHNDGLVVIAEGHPVTFAATYWRPSYKTYLRDLLDRITVPMRIFELSVQDEVVEERIKQRLLGWTPSDINTMEQYLRMKKSFDPITFVDTIRIDTTRPLEVCMTEVFEHLTDLTRK